MSESTDVLFEHVVALIGQLNLDGMYLVRERRATAQKEFAARSSLWLDVHKRIENNDAWEAFLSWSSVLDDSRKRERQLCRNVLFLFDEFSKMDVPPFNQRKSHFIEVKPKFDWSKLSSELQFLAEPAERYGAVQFPNEVTTFLEKITIEQQIEFDRLIKQLNEYSESVEHFLDQFRMTKHPEARHVYFLWNLLAHYADSKQSSDLVEL